MLVLLDDLATQGQAQSVKETASVSINTERDTSSRVMDVAYWPLTNQKVFLIESDRVFHAFSFRHFCAGTVI